MNKNWVSWCLQLGVFGAMVAGAIASCFECAQAQSKIVPDGTLGADSSVVQPYNSLIEVISGGAIRGSNLFHSFLEFNVSPGRGAYFYSPNVDIQNILARVTGSNRSEILGTLGTFGNSNPNLFLINPNGIIFGPNASLNIGGSFVATTANAVRLGDTGLFSASQPTSSNLLSVNPSAFLFNAVSNPRPIIVNSSTTGLDVPDGRSLLLLGGNVQLDGATLFVPNGRVELGGVSGSGTVGLNIVGNYLSLSFPQQVQLADVSVTNGSNIQVPASDGGSTAINASNQDTLGGINITAGSVALTNGAQLTTRTFGQGNAGSITINARDTVLNGGSVGSATLEGAKAKGGNINISTGSLTVRNGAQLTTRTFGQGNAGSITINARDTVLNGGSVDSVVSRTAFGNGGNINISTGSLTVRNGAVLGTTTAGGGNAGSITINAHDTVTLDGVGIISNNREPSPSGVLSSTTAFGKAGDINITTGSLALTNGAGLGTRTAGGGNAGSITINAHDTVTLDGVSSDGSLPSSVGSDVLEAAFGNGGNINIITGSLTVRNGAGLSTSTAGGGNAGSITINARDRVGLDGKSSVYSDVFSDVSSNVFGNGGDINITTGSLALTNGARLNTITSGGGNAGSITINAHDTVSFDHSRAFSRVGQGAFGKAGNINITTASLALTNGAQLDTTTYGQASAGNVTINARNTVTFDGSIALSRVEPGAKGKAGDINITTGTLALTHGAIVDTRTFGQGSAGNVTINARDTVTFDGTLSEALSRVEEGAVGTGGDINITTGSLTVRNGAQLIASTNGGGNAGNVTINARDTVTFDGKGSDDSPSGVFSRVDSTGVGKGGTIDITTGSLTLTNGAQLSVRTEGQGNAGNVKINARDQVTFDGTFVTTDGTVSHSGASSQVNPTGVGKGGTIDITTGSLTLTNGAQLSALTQGQGSAGSVTINARNTLQFNNGEIFTNATSNATSAEGGNVTITAKDIRLRNNSGINTFLSSGQGSGGNITLTANTILALENSDILAFAPQGRGGNITFNTLAFLSDPLYRPSPPTTDPVTFDSLRNNGRVDVNASGAVSGAITGVPDISFIQNSLSELPQNLIDPNVLIANSCIARSRKQQGTFTITGSGGLPNRPGDAVLSTYPTGDVRSVPGGAASHPWHKGDPIVEPQGVYHLTNGQLVLSRECSE